MKEPNIVIRLVFIFIFILSIIFLMKLSKLLQHNQYYVAESGVNIR